MPAIILAFLLGMLAMLLIVLAFALYDWLLGKAADAWPERSDYPPEPTPPADSSSGPR